MSKKGLLKSTVDALLAVTRVQVKSSNIESLGYHDTTKSVVVAFHSGDIWAYMGIDHEVFTAFVNAESIGKYFHAKIRNNAHYSDFKLT